MKQHLPLLEHTLLFRGISQKEIVSILDCLSARCAYYEKEQFIFRPGDTITHVGMVLTGIVHIVKEDFWGNKSIISEIPEGSLFAETYACISSEPFDAAVMAAVNCDILFLDFQKIQTVCSSTCIFHTRLIHNLLTVLAEKNLMLTKKMEHMSKKTTRDKLLSYLSNRSAITGSSAFEIPFNRQQLADYLSVDRSAMCNEMSKLRAEGILTFKKNKFILKEDFDEQN